MGPAWGIDIRRARIDGVVLEDPGAPRTLRRMRVPAESEKGYYHVLGQVHKLVEVLSSEVGVRPERIGVSCAGSLDPITKTVKNAGIAALDGKPLLSDLETYLGVPVRLDNAANCLALAETRFGTVTEVMPTARCVVALLLDDTVEGGVVVNGRVMRGRQGIAGSWGHNYLDDRGGPCACGRHGCVQTVIGAEALGEYYAESGGYAPDVAEAITALDDRDDAAARTAERLVYNFAKAVGPVINVIDPDCIVIGGRLAGVDALYDQGPELLKRFVHNTRVDTVVLRPKLGHGASAVGAALL